MWVFLPEGFVSIVAHTTEPDTLLVRARQKRHLEAFLAIDPGDGSEAPPVLDLLRSDYRWRVFLPREAVAGRLAEHARTMAYGNFKNSIPARLRRYHDACLAVWAELLELQSGGNRWRSSDNPMP